VSGDSALNELAFHNKKINGLDKQLTQKDLKEASIAFES
jgi:hypothetical protein